MRPSRFILAGSLILFFLLDRFIKNIAIVKPSFVEGLFFYWQPVFNTQGPFSLPLPGFILFTVAAAALVWLTRLCWQSWLKNEFRLFLGSGLMIVGGYSNFWDRLIHDGVVDVWHFTFGASSLNFNLADLYLLSGLLVIISSYQKRRSVLAS